jgi:protein KRI1
LEKVAGTEKIKELADELKKEFDPENFDKIMNRIYNKDYYDSINKEKEENEKEKIIEEKSFDYRCNKAISDKENLIQDDEDMYNDNEYNNDNEDENDNENNEWFYCDECLKAIKENKIKYECETCEDYTLCKSCFSSKNHQHQMKKSKVPFGCKVNFYI